MTQTTTKFKRWFYSDYVQSHWRQFRNIWLSIMIWDGIADVTKVYNGDFSSAALTALGTASVGAVVKTLFQIFFPQFFTLKTAASGDVKIQMTEAMNSVTVKKV